MMKVLTIDIETSPNLAYVWGQFKQDINIDAVKVPGEILCWAAKWHGEKKIHFSDKRDGDMLLKMHKLLAEADAVVGYYSSRFDIPWLNGQFLKAGLKPPGTYKQVDLKIQIAKKFRFFSNKLDYVLRELNLGHKVKHSGFSLWLGCMNGDKKAWAQMREYNIGDVVKTEQLYDRILPWIDGHPNANLYHEYSGLCPNCGGDKIQRRGVAHTAVSTYARYQCQSCGKWMRGSKNLLIKHRREFVMRNVQ